MRYTSRRCVSKFNQIYEYPLLAYFMWNMLALSSLLVTLQFQLVEYWFQYNYFLHKSTWIKRHVFLPRISKWADDSNSFEFAVLFVAIAWATMFVFVLCEPGRQMTTQFEMFGDELGRFDWYLLPIELQRMYRIFLADTQYPVDICSYGGITCDRETSKRVGKVVAI